MRTKMVTLALVLGLVLAGGGAGVIANHNTNGETDGSPPASAGHGKYCNSGNGNGYEVQPPEWGDPGEPFPAPGNQGDEDSIATAETPPVPECDPGNSASHNRDNDREATAGPSRFSP